MEGGERSISSTLEIFSGDEDKWPDWKSKFCSLLFIADPAMHRTLGTERPVGDANAAAAAEYDTRSASIFSRLNILVKGIPAGIVRGFFPEMDGVGAWKALLRKYEHDGTYGHAFLHAKIMNAKIPSNGDPDEYFALVEGAQARLAELGHPISDDVMLGAGMAALPESYDRLTAILDTIPDLTNEFFKGHVRAFYRRSIHGKGHSSDDAESAKALMTQEAEGEAEYESEKSVPSKLKHRRPKPKKNWKHAEESDDHRERVHFALSAFHADCSPGGKGGTSTDQLLSFIVDSRASTHMSNAVTLLEDVVLERGTVTVASGRVLTSTGKGTLKATAFDIRKESCAICLFLMS